MDLDARSILVSNVATEMRAVEIRSSRRYRNLPSTDTIIKVFSNVSGRNHVVNLAERTCTCQSWQKMGIPCSHAISAIRFRKEDPQSYALQYYHLSAFRNTYATAIIPPQAEDGITAPAFTYRFQFDDVDGEFQDLEDVDIVSNRGQSQDGEDGKDDEEEEDNGARVLPPHTRRPPGRPPTKRKSRKRKLADVTEGNIADDETSTIDPNIVRPVRCGRCDQTGHNRRSCREPI
jgi:hypothetical protein